MVNRKHWFSDVLAGAGIGIISVELSYRLLPVWHRLFKMNQENSCVIINPLVNENGWGVGIILAL
jgi:membrane-associated phospholipid phosphatase